MATTYAQNSVEIENDLLPMLTVDRVAAIMAVSTKTVRRMIDRGVLPSCRVGRLVRVRHRDLERYIASSADPQAGRSQTTMTLA